MSRGVAGSCDVLPSQKANKTLRTIWDKPLVVNEFKNTRVASTMATASRGGCAVQDVLNTEVDFVSRSISSNLDAISERGQGSVGPATSAVLRNVLVQRMGGVTFAINVAPVPVVL